MMHGAPIKSVKVTSQVWPVSEKNIVYIEGRNGNSPAKYQQVETLIRAFSFTGSAGHLHQVLSGSFGFLPTKGN